MSRRYNGAIKRSERLNKDILMLVETIERLEEANRILRKNKETYKLREEARERVLQSLNDTSI